MSLHIQDLLFFPFSPRLALSAQPEAAAGPLGAVAEGGG